VQHRNSTLILAMAAGYAALLTGCSTEPTGPVGPVGPPAATSPLSVSAFATRLSSGPVRIEVQLKPGSPLVAREIEVEPDDAEEKLVAKVTAIDGAAGTLTLDLEGAVVHYGIGTRFRTPSQSHVSQSDWVTAIQTALDAHQTPQIEARRSIPSTPQAPDDASFAAGDLRLSDRDEGRNIEIYVDEDNFALTPSPTLTVLGLNIAIAEDTDLHERHDDGAPNPPSSTVEFEDTVVSVSVVSGSMTLKHGTVLVVTAANFDPLGDLFGLQATEAAINAGALVRVEGLGTVSAEGPPRVIDVTLIKVEVDGNGGGGNPGGTGMQFKASVTAVDPAGGSLTLSDGTVIEVGSITWDPLGDVFTLQATANALDAGKIVTAEGIGTVTDAGPPVRMTATALKVETR
jgi:hypothetical protein